MHTYISYLRVHTRVRKVSIKVKKIKHIEPKLAFLERLCLKFPEYTLWLMTERTDPPNHIDPYMYEMRQQRIKDEENL